ncbi:MAG: AmmeMemoRadiSam system radical SAM enzyme [Acidobacteria bacterium]|nr:AmmeMemoRadiSam system radical SAM enzyme [Acidobacteriota bacterium]
MTELSEILAALSVPGELCEKLEEMRVRCFACAHRCSIPDGKSGICKVRFNDGGILRVPSGYVAGAQCDPIEKKPFYHVRPGSSALSFGMLGCNFHCGYCQNWISSQTLRDPRALVSPRKTSADALVRLALAQGADIVVSTYNEPLISCEWSVAVFKLAKAAGLMTGYVSNGYGTPEVLQYLHPWLDLFKVDLKCFDDRHYRRLGGRLQPVLDTIRNIHSLGMWLEVVTLLVPGFNDSTEELTALTAFLSSVSADIPWHITAFHRDYKMTDANDTSLRDLLGAVEIGKRNGLRYVYAGNMPGRTENCENTFCPECGEILVERYGFQILQYRLAAGGHCPSCNHKIPGRWAE